MSHDPILLEVYRHRLESLCEEMGAALERSAYSANIKERRDYSCSLFDGCGRLAAQGDHMPVHLGSMPLSVEAALEHRPPQPGDVILLNDPFRGGTHLPDLTMVAPLHVGEDPQALFHLAVRAHHADVGGMTPGSMPLSREIFQEGLRIPPVRFVRGGDVEPDLLELVLANVRTPEERRGDLRAQLASVHRGRLRMEELIREKGCEEVASYAHHLMDYSERRLRAAIRTMPRGSWEFEDALEPMDGPPLRLRVRLEIGEDEVVLDFSGTSPQMDGPLNANRAVTLSACVYALRCLVPDDIPFNEGCFRPMEVRTPPGSLVDARVPAAVCGGNVETSQRVVDTVFGAFGRALGDRLPAASQGTMNNITLGGRDPRTGRSFTYYETVAGGVGAGPGGPGASGLHTHMTNTRNTPVEALEHAYPLQVRTLRLRRGSGGDGRFRGGEGLVRSLAAETPLEVTVLSERRSVGPWGASGGKPGACGRNRVLRGGGEEEVLPARARCCLEPGDVLEVATPGGGGWGPSEGSGRASKEGD